MKRLKEILKSKTFLCYLFIIIVALVMSIPLFQAGIHTGHDGDFHISRTIGTMEEIEHGNSPLVISRFSRNLGFAWNLFYPPVSTIINVFFGFLTNNVVLAMKIFIFITFLFSGITMYQLVKTISKSNLAALLAAILYMTAPYRMLNAYTRLAVGEMASFIFIPIVLRGIYLFFNGKPNKSYLYVWGAIGLVLSHNISTMLTFIVGVVYVLMNIKKLKDKQLLKTFLISSGIIVLSVIFFELPLLEQMSTTKYEVSRKMYTDVSVMNSALNPLKLIFKDVPGCDNSMYFCIGIPLLIGLILTPFVYKQAKQIKNYRFFLIAGFVSAIMSTFIVPWFAMPDPLQMIQFPWRMLEMIIFFFSVVCGINFVLFMNMVIDKVYDFRAKKSKTVTQPSNKTSAIFKYCSSALITILSCIYALSFLKGTDYKVIDNSYYEEPEVIDYSWQVSRYSSYLEYWPQKAINNWDYSVNRDDKVAILSGSADIQNESKVNGILDFDISNVSDNTSLELPYLFYKGYQVTYTPSDGSEAKKLDVTESENGFVQVNIDSSMNGHIQVAYHATTLYKICFVISMVTMIAYIIYLIIRKVRTKKLS